MNLYFGSVLATIALTVPSVLFIGSLMGQEVRLGLSPADMVLLITTLMVCKVTFSSGRTTPCTAPPILCCLSFTCS